MNDERPYYQRLENAYASTVPPVNDGIQDFRLKGRFEDYLTDLEGSKCDILEDFDFNLIPFKWRNKSNLMDEFKKECEEIDNEKDT